ncbi:MAG: hypothetical protein HY394_02415 [Candidatus Diapherotrites archaeon]|nr:hypothetical protein [Candidatus Diapherotrites archaeon]
MKKSFIAVSIFFLIFLLGCAQQGTGIGGVSLKDCGNDATCFDAASQKCEAAKATLSQSTEQGSVQTYAESRGKSGGNCEFYSKIIKFDIATDAPGVSPEFSAKVNALVKGLEGKDMVCRVPEDKAKSQVLDFAESQDLFEKYCSGALKDELSALQSKLADLVQQELQAQIAAAGPQSGTADPTAEQPAYPDYAPPVDETGSAQ